MIAEAGVDQVELALERLADTVDVMVTVIMDSATDESSEVIDDAAVVETLEVPIAPAAVVELAYGGKQPYTELEQAMDEAYGGRAE